MKRNLLGLFAMVLAIGFSAFTNKKSDKTNGAYYWFLASDPHDLVGNTPNTVPPTGYCNEAGEGCIVGFYSDTEIFEYPGGIPDQTYRD